MEENQKTTVEEGAGTYDFTKLTGMDLNQEEEPQEETPKFDVVNQPGETLDVEESTETEEGSPEEKQETPANEDAAEDQKKEIEEEQKQAENTSNYSNLAKKYVDTGLWADGAIEVDGEPVPISELDSLDEDTFLQIEEAQRRKKDKEYEEKFVNTEDLDEVSKQILEISKNGGNITDLLNAKRSMIDPLDTYDLNNEQHQEVLVRHMYQAENRSLTPKQIDRLIEADKDDMVLDSKAEQFVNNVRQSYQQQIEKEKEAALQAKEDEKKSLRDLKKNLKQELKELGMKNDSFINPILQAATNKTKEGFEVDREFQEMKKDPKVFAEYLAWKYDRENFLKSTVSKLSTKRDTKQLELLDLSPKGGNKKPERKEKSQPNRKLEDDFLANVKVENRQ